MGDINKKYLKARRKMIWKKKLANAGLDLEMYPWWSDEDKVVERGSWAEADTDYEAMKTRYGIT